VAGRVVGGGKTKDVGRAVDATVFQIQLVDKLVVRYHDADLLKGSRALHCDGPFHRFTNWT